MGSLSASAALQLPVRMRGITLGQPVDLIVDVGGWQTIGFVVRCGDASRRFLPYAASQPGDEEVAVASALMLLEDVGFYESRGVSFRSLLDGEVVGAGVLRDLLIGDAGAIVSLEVERDGGRHRIPAAGSTILPTRATAA
jgi:hypothetical protein